jgi:hypothetical protein
VGNSDTGIGGPTLFVDREAGGILASSVRRGAFMPTVLLNGSTYAIDSAPATWHDLLALLDRDLDREGRTVASVRFDGIDEPAFRAPDLLTRALTPADVIEVDVDTPRGLILRALDEASASVPEVAQAAVLLAGQYRGGAHLAQTNQELGTFAETLSHLMALVAAAGQVLQVNLREVDAADGPVADTITQLDAAVTAMLDAHANQDWITLADSLEYDLAPLVPRLRGVIDHLAAVAA